MEDKKYKIKGKNELVDFNKEKYYKDDGYKKKMDNLLIRKYFIKYRKGTAFSFMMDFTIPECRIILKRGNLRMHYDLKNRYLSPNIVKSTTKVSFSSDDEIGNNYIIQLFNYYEFNSIDLHMNDEGDTLYFYIFEEEEKGEVNFLELTVNNLLKKFIPFLKGFEDYVDLEVLINGKFYSIEDVNALNEDLFAPATDKDIKNYLIHKNFS